MKKSDSFIRAVDKENEMVKGITFIGECQASVNHAGNKARADVDVILREKYGFPYETLGETIFTGFLDRIKYLLKFSALQKSGESVSCIPKRL